MVDVQLVSDDVVGGVRVVHWLCYGAAPYAGGLPAEFVRSAAGQAIKERRWKDADIPSIEHLEARWRVCEVVTVRFHYNGWLMAEGRFAQVGRAGNFKDALHDGMMAYLEAERKVPHFAWVHDLPQGVQEFDEYMFGKTCITVIVEGWAPADMVMLGNGGGKVTPIYVGCDKEMEVLHE